MVEYKLLKIGKQAITKAFKKYQNIIMVFCSFCSMCLSADLYDYFKEFCQIGERSPNTPGHRLARDYIISHLDNPEIDSFFQEGIWFYNIYKKFSGTGELIGIAAHWDSDINCPGANDGGSGVSILLKLADTLKKNPPRLRVHLLFFDGEDLRQAELVGSNHFAAKCLERYSFILVIDMVGDRDLQIYQEGHSVKFFPQLVDSIWRIGMNMAPNVFFPSVKYYIIDDHIALLKYGIPAIDIIDFDYPYWDTKDDTIDKCSNESLKIVYQFLLNIVYEKGEY